MRYRWIASLLVVLVLIGLHAWRSLEGEPAQTSDRPPIAGPPANPIRIY